MKNDFSLILGDKSSSSWSLRAWLMLKQLGVKFDERVIKLETEQTRAEILEYVPSGKVPALIHNENICWDSLSIAEYLNELFPTAKVWPINQSARVYARNISNEMHAGFANLRQLMPFNLNEFKSLPISLGLEQDIQRIEAIWQECRANYSNSGEYLFGEFSIADAMYAPIVLRFRSYNYKSSNPVVIDYCQTILNNQFIHQRLNSLPI